MNEQVNSLPDEFRNSGSFDGFNVLNDS